MQPARREARVANDPTIGCARLSMPAIDVSFDFVLGGEYLEVCESPRSFGDVLDRANHHVARQVVDDTARNYEIKTAIRKETRQIIERTTHNVAARTEPTHGVFARIDALIPCGRPESSDNGLPAPFAGTCIQNGPHWVGQYVFRR